MCSSSSIPGPPLFVIYINDVLKHYFCDLFGDGCAVHTSDYNCNNILKTLQKDINNLIKRGNNNDMLINTSKSKSILITAIKNE